MKKKYRGFLAVGFISLALAYTAAYAAGGASKNNNKIRLRPLRPLPVISALTRVVLKEIDHLEALLAETMPSPESASHTVDLSAFGYQPSDEATQVNRVADGEPAIRMNYSLTFTFLSETKKFCIIDGMFSTVGDRLPDGGEIVEIKPHRVLVRKQNAESWLHPDRGQ